MTAANQGQEVIAHGETCVTLETIHHKTRNCKKSSMQCIINTQKGTTTCCQKIDLVENIISAISVKNQKKLAEYSM